ERGVDADALGEAALPPGRRSVAVLGTEARPRPEPAALVGGEQRPGALVQGALFGGVFGKRGGPALDGDQLAPWIAALGEPVGVDQARRVVVGRRMDRREELVLAGLERGRERSGDVEAGEARQGR